MGTVFDEIAFASENLGIVLTNDRAGQGRGSPLPGGRLACWRMESTQLSSGQKQRVALAAAIAKVPRLLVLDEPTSNLDEEGARVLVDILADLKQKGIALVISEHRLQPFRPVADCLPMPFRRAIAKRCSAVEFMGLSADQVAVYGLRHPEAECEGTYWVPSREAEAAGPVAATPSDPLVLHAGDHSAHMRLRPASASGRSNASSPWDATLTRVGLVGS